jgi:cyclic pyranopterin phosphate synthase
VVEIVRRIAPYADEVSMTTNGSLLENKASDLRSAGLRRVNISFHSRRAGVIRRITKCDALLNMEGGIRAAVDAGLKPVKLNMVVLEGLNEGEIPDMIEFSKELGAILQLIEFQPLERGIESWGGYYYDLQPLEKMLEARSDSVYERRLQRRRQYLLKGGGIVEVVRPMHNSNFCRSCTRLRVTSDGRLKPCLMRNDNLVEAVSLLRLGAAQNELADAFREAIAKRRPYWREKAGG